MTSTGSGTDDTEQAVAVARKAFPPYDDFIQMGSVLFNTQKMVIMLNNSIFLIAHIILVCRFAKSPLVNPHDHVSSVGGGVRVSTTQQPGAADPRRREQPAEGAGSGPSRRASGAGADAQDVEEMGEDGTSGGAQGGSSADGAAGDDEAAWLREMTEGATPVAPRHQPGGATENKRGTGRTPGIRIGGTFPPMVYLPLRGLNRLLTTYLIQVQDKIRCARTRRALQGDGRRRESTRGHWPRRWA
jgi:hypothetical protein